MPRRSLANVSIQAIQAEIQRRLSHLSDLVRQRDELNRQIAALEVLTGSAQPTRTVRKTARRKKRLAPAARTPQRKVAPVAAAAKPATNRRGRGNYKQTADEYVLSLLAGGKVMSTSDLVAAWGESGRGGKIDNALTRLVKERRVKREKAKQGKGSLYTRTA
jgi:stalled ribosome alternative rescue factor ArfA